MTVKYYRNSNKRTNVRIKNISGYVLYFISSILWFIYPNLVRRFIIKHFFVPKRFPLSKIEIEVLEQGHSFYLSVNDQRLQCWKYGHGPVIIFIHGWNGRGIQFKRFFNKAIKSGFSVVIFDGPGHGLSGGKTSSYFEMTDALRAVINYCRTSQNKVIGLVGHSFGAAAIINALPKEKLNIPAVLIAPALNIRQMLKNAFSRYGVPMKIYYSLIADYSRKFGYNLDEDDPVLLINDLSNKILIIHDIEDKVTPLEISRNIAEGIDSINLLETEGLGHSRILNSKKIIEETLSFISNNNSNIQLNIQNEQSYKMEQ